MKYYKKINSPLGTLTLVEEDEKLSGIFYENEEVNLTNIKEKDTELLLKTEKELNEYFLGKRKSFDIPLKLVGTHYQLKVWKELMNIKYNELLTYKDIAIKINNPKSFRAVGLANNKNRIPIIIPCHRVIGSNKKLIGYSAGLDKKEFLINLEREHSND